jgi:hypothetical protein
MRGCGSLDAGFQKYEPTEVVMARASGPDFRRECGREDSNLQGPSPSGT